MSLNNRCVYQRRRILRSTVTLTDENGVSTTLSVEPEEDTILILLVLAKREDYNARV